jgi:hypothetical protein
MCGQQLRSDTIKYGQFGTQNNPGTGAGGSNPNPAAGVFGLMLAMAAKAERQRLGREPTSKELLTRTGYKFTNKTTPGGPIDPGVYDATLAALRGEGSPTQQQQAPPPRQSSGLSIQSGPSVRTGSGTRVAARKRATARQSRTKRFTTR